MGHRGTHQANAQQPDANLLLTGLGAHAHSPLPTSHNSLARWRFAVTPMCQGWVPTDLRSPCRAHLALRARCPSICARNPGRASYDPRLAASSAFAMSLINTIRCIESVGEGSSPCRR